MKKRIVFLLVLTTVVLSSFQSCTTISDSGNPEMVTDTNNQINVQNNVENQSAQRDEAKTYNIGETWTVDGQWSLTVTSVEETTERNEYADTNPTAVYIVNYTYTNIGYVDTNGIMNGLFFSMDNSIIDNASKMGYSYPGEITYYAQEAPVGASCDAQACIGVGTAGDFKINVAQYDENEVEQKAVFNITVN